MRSKTKAWLNAIFLVLTLIVNAMGAMGLINGLSQKEVSDIYQTLITPAPTTFSIWSVIYTFLFISVIAMIIKNKDTYYSLVIDGISSLFWLSCILNIMWILSFSYTLIGLSTFFIFALLLVLVLINERIGNIQMKNHSLLPITFGLYGGWLFIATVVNIAVWLVSIEWEGFGISDEIWSCIILLVAIGLTFIVVQKIKNALFPIPIAWAYVGIYRFHLAPDGFNGKYSLLPTVVLIGIVLLIGLSAIRFYKNKYKIIPTCVG